MRDKKLVDANTIDNKDCCLHPEKGDLVRIVVGGNACLAFCNVYGGNYALYCSTQDGVLYSVGDVKVLEILGKCVFSIYV